MGSMIAEARGQWATLLIASSLTIGLGCLAVRSHDEDPSRRDVEVDQLRTPSESDYSYRDTCVCIDPVCIENPLAKGC